MFKLSAESVLEKSNRLAFKKGSRYLFSGRIKSVQFNQENSSFNAVILGTRLYNVSAAFSLEGELANFQCSCPDFDSGSGLCKHLVCLLLFIQEKDRQGFFRQLKFRQAAKQIFNFFQLRPAVARKSVRLEAGFQYDGNDRRHKGCCASMSLKIGVDRLYTVRNIKEFLYSLEKGEEITFGKYFSFDPAMHTFHPDDRPLIEFLKELNETENLMNSLSAGITRASLFRGREVYLTDAGIKRFFSICAQKPFNAVVNEVSLDRISVTEESIPVKFKLDRENNDLVLEIAFEGALSPLTEDGEYFFAESRIYKTSERQREGLKPFYMAMLCQKTRKLRFIEDDKERFVSEILPFAEKAGKLEVSPRVRSMIERAELSAEVYLDKLEGDVTAEVRFNYGERSINPFSAASGQSGGNKILLRDIARETAILDILGQSDFIVRNGKLQLSGDDSIFTFVVDTVPKLSEHASVYYSESFKAISVKNSVSCYGRLGISEASGILEFSFGIEDIDRSELAGILESLRERKRYYRLKDGRLLNLALKELNGLSALFDSLGLKKKDLTGECIPIPAYRGLYLDQGLRELGLYKVERSRLFKQFVRNVREPSDMEFEVPASLKPIMRDYQKYGFKWLKTLAIYGLGGILADDMGLGKTLQVISLILSAGEENGRQPSMVVVPSSLIFNWCAEIDKFAPSLKYLAVTGNKEERRRLSGELADCDVVITSYPLLRRDIELYAGITFRYLLLDEAQHIKNPGSLNAHSVKKLRAGTRIALTGTPMENNLSELWSIFDFIIPGYLYTRNVFSEKYEVPVSVEDTDVMESLSKQISPFILRRLKKDVLRELPEKIENRMVAELTEEQKRVYLAYLLEARGELEKDFEELGFEKSRIRILAALTRLRQLCCHPGLFIENYKGDSGKLMLLKELVCDSMEAGHRILVFSQFTGMLRMIRSWLEAEQIGHSYLDGSTPVEERGRMVNAFNNGRGKLFLISLKAGGTGLNLTGADTVIHYDPWWNPAVEDQATDRAYRMGQNKTVHVIKLIAKGTIEEKIYALQEKKKALIDSVIRPGETLVTKLTRQELESLFE